MTSIVTPLTEPLRAEIQAWLDAEEAAYEAAEETALDEPADAPVRGFRCNWDSTVRDWRDYNAPVDVLIVDGAAAGFLAGTDILEIRPDLRRRGLGRILANFMIERAEREDCAAIEIEIAPRSAEPFWKSMGFTPIEGLTGSGSGLNAWRLLPRIHGSQGGAPVRFRIGFYPPNAPYDAGLRAFHEVEGVAERRRDGGVGLPERIIGFQPARWTREDIVVRIEIEGQEIYFDKAKYPEARLLGVQRDPAGIPFIDVIREPSESVAQPSETWVT